MAWAGGVWNTTGGTSTGNISMGASLIYYDRRLLRRAAKRLFMWQLGQKRPLPEGNGRQIQFYRYHDIAEVTSVLTEGTNPEPTAITGHEVNATLETFGGFSQQSELLEMTHVDKLNGLVDLWGDQAGRSIDLRVMKEVVTNGAMQLRADNAAGQAGYGSGQWKGISTGTASTTTVIYCADGSFGSTSTNLDQTNDFWIGGAITFTSGKNYGQTRYISDSDGTTKQVTVTLPFENAPANTDTFIISHPGKSAAAPVADAMDTTDPLTHKTFTKTWERLMTYEAAPLEDDFFVIVVGPTAHAGFMSDATWIGLQQYTPGQASKLYNGEIGRYMGFRVITTTRPFRAPLPTTATTGGPGQSSTTHVTSGSNYSATGSGHYSLAMGREAFGVSHFPGWNKPKIYVKRPGAQSTDNPLEMYSTIGWKIPFVPMALNSLWCFAIVSGA